MGPENSKAECERLALEDVLTQEKLTLSIS